MRRRPRPGSGRRGTGRQRARCSGRDTEPTLFELSEPGRKAWQLRTTGLPELALEELVPEAHRRASPGGAGRGVRARPRRALHPALATGSSPSTSAPTRSARAR